MSEVKQAIDYNEKMAEALELIGDMAKGFNMDDFLKAKHIFKEIHDYVQDVPMFADSKDKYNQYKVESEREWPDLKTRIEKVWLVFLNKIVSAPTSLHRIGCVILQIPYVHELITEYEQS